MLEDFADNQDKQKYFVENMKLKSLFGFCRLMFLKQYIRPFEWVTSFYLAF